MSIYLIHYQVRYPRDPDGNIIVEWPVETFFTMSDCSMGAINNLDRELPKSPYITRSASTWLHIRHIQRISDHIGR